MKWVKWRIFIKMKIHLKRPRNVRSVFFSYQGRTLSGAQGPVSLLYKMPGPLCGRNGQRRSEDRISSSFSGVKSPMLAWWVSYCAARAPFALFGPFGSVCNSFGGVRRLLEVWWPHRPNITFRSHVGGVWVPWWHEGPVGWGLTLMSRPLFAKKKLIARLIHTKQGSVPKVAGLIRPPNKKKTGYAFYLSTGFPRFFMEGI